MKKKKSKKYKKCKYLIGCGNVSVAGFCSVKDLSVHIIGVYTCLSESKCKKKKIITVS